MKILYIYDRPNWAIYNVGKLWLDGLKGIETSYIQFKDIPKISFANFDTIWYGWSGMFLWSGKFTKQNNQPIIKRVPPIKNLINIKKSVLSIHDPCEIFTLAPNWKDQRIGRKIRWIAKHARGIITASDEMQMLLQKKGISALKIPTMGILPPIEENAIITNKCNAYGVFSDIPRKNPGLMENLRRFCKEDLIMRFDYKVGYTVLSEEEYIKELDSHEIYVCTSLQEGGPIPAMDAMARGAVVITTPVGQLQEFIVNGQNGFICANEEEFRKVFRLLKNDLDLLHKMRHASRRTILEKRNKEDIQKKVHAILSSLKH